MTMIGLELNDAGLMAAGSDGALLEPEAGSLASPGVAVIDAGGLQAGIAAERCCRRVPRQTNRHFWDQLASDPLQDPAFAGWTHADLAHAHLSAIWNHLAPAHQEVLVAVPNSYSGPQLELLAGIMTALSIPVRGFVALPLCALPKSAPAEMLLHLELYRHRCVLSVLDNRRAPTVLGSAAVDGMGLERLQAAWMQVIADEFVRHTRYDPFHDADAEQTLYDQLPDLLAALNAAEDTAVEMATPSTTHRIRLARGQLEQALIPLMDAVHRQFNALGEDVLPQAPGTILVGHRAAGLPGFCRRLEGAVGIRPQALAEGAAAKGVLAFGDDFPRREGGQGVPFLKHKPGAKHRPDPDSETKAASPAEENLAATHLLYRNRGYPITDRPLVIGRQIPSASHGILIRGHTAGVSRRHCSVVCREGRPILTDTSTYGTFVDGVRVNGQAPLTLGQTIRVGAPGEQLQVIACLEHDETPLA
ncbi:MAG: FHA domain-containing protein [Desulfobacterales bacterium]|jgi:hypothetical protein